MDTLNGRDVVTIADLARDEIGAVLDQARRFESAVAWYTHFRQLYGDLSDNTPITRLTFRIDEMFTKR